MTTLLDKIFGTYLGIEFREDSVVITYLKNNFSGITLMSSSTFPLKSGETVSDEVREYVSRHGINVNRVFVTIPDRWAIMKFIDIPSVKGRGRGALANLMKFEIERHIPFELDDVAYDFLVLDERDMRYYVVFAAVQKEKIDFVRDYLGKLSLQPHTITISSFAVLNSIELCGVSAGGWQEIIGIVRKSDMLGKKGETNISVYIGETNASVAIIKDGLCVHQKSFILSHPPDAFLIEMAQYLTEMQSALGIEHFDRLLLAGDSSYAEALKGELNGKLKIDDIAVNRVERFSGSLKGVQVDGLSPSIGACFAGLGIGTYTINLLPHKTDYEIKKIAPMATRIFIILILVLLVGIFTAEALKQKTLLTKVDEVLKKNEPEVREIERMLSDIDSLKRQSDFLHTIQENRIALEVLAELSSIMPRQAWITNLHYKGFDIKDRKKTGGELIISGYADSSSSLIPLLEDSPLFEKVEFVGPIKKTRDKEQFKLSAKIVRPLKDTGQTPEAKETK